MAYGYPTTRRFARSTMQAFQQDQGEWWFPPERTTGEKVWLYASIAFFLCSVLFVLGAS
jgi:hypothetical protein